MKEGPILFRGPMATAILEGRKTQTRRVIKPQPPSDIEKLHGNEFRTRAPYKCYDSERGLEIGFGFQDDDDTFYRCPYGTVGDRLWVREKWAVSVAYDSYSRDLTPHVGTIQYAAGGGRLNGQNIATTCFNTDGERGKWRPSIHMPRWASRITLEITGVRVERLNEISEGDAIAEGSQCAGVPSSLTNVGAFAKLWESINGEGSWSVNPWVWVVEFKRI